MYGIYYGKLIHGIDYGKLMHGIDYGKLMHGIYYGKLGLAKNQKVFLSEGGRSVAAQQSPYPN